MANSSESDELSVNMDNYISVTNNKMLLYTVDVTVEEKLESLTISHIKSNVEVKTQMKTKSLQKEISCLQRKELSKENEASMDVEVDLYNKDSTK